MTTTNIFQFDGARSFAAGSAKALEKLEHAASNIRSFREENTRYPTDWEINCTNYQVIQIDKKICIQTIFLQSFEGENDFIITYKSLGMPFSGKMGAGLKREFTYNTETKSFNYSHLDTYAEVIFSLISKVLMGLLLILLPILYLRSSRVRVKY